MGKDKLKRFAEIATFPNVFQRDCTFKGKWNQEFFKNDHPIILELGCGRGEYTVNLAQHFPEKNFIGIDVKGARLWRGAKTAVEEKMNNVAFLRIQIESLMDYFGENEIAEIWITFPDPQPTSRREKKRLTYNRYLEYYRILLSPNGIVHLKTDNDGLYAYTQEKLEELKLISTKQTDDLYNSELLDEILSIKTTYEARYLKEGKNINYINFKFD